MDNTAHTPVDDIRIGRIKAAIWANTAANGQIRYTVSLTRLYKTDKGWRHSQSFGQADLRVVATVVDQAHARIVALQSDSDAERPADTGNVPTDTAGA